MQLTTTETILTLLAITAGTVLTRFTPFILFRGKIKESPYLNYLGKTLPAAMMGLLVVYCLKNVSITEAPNGIPELIAIAVIVFLHKWKHNTILSIVGGTAVYMVLVQTVF